MKEFSKLKVLVVDDQTFSRAIVIKSLTNAGLIKINIDEAQDGLTGINALLSKPYDLVISDWNMPVMNGLEFLKKVRSSQRDFKDIAFILSTTDSEKEKIIEALNFNVTDYIIKPMSDSVLAEKLNDIFT